MPASSHWDCVWTLCDSNCERHWNYDSFIDSCMARDTNSAWIASVYHHRKILKGTTLHWSKLVEKRWVQEHRTRHGRPKMEHMHLQPNEFPPLHESSLAMGKRLLFWDIRVAVYRCRGLGAVCVDMNPVGLLGGGKANRVGFPLVGGHGNTGVSAGMDSNWHHHVWHFHSPLGTPLPIVSTSVLVPGSPCLTGTIQSKLARPLFASLILRCTSSKLPILGGVCRVLRSVLCLIAVLVSQNGDRFTYA